MSLHEATITATALTSLLLATVNLVLWTRDWDVVGRVWRAIGTRNFVFLMAIMMFVTAYSLLLTKSSIPGVALSVVMIIISGDNLLNGVAQRFYCR